MDLLIVIAAFFVAIAAPIMSSPGADAADTELLEQWTDDGADEPAAKPAEATDPSDETPADKT